MAEEKKVAVVVGTEGVAGEKWFGHEVLDCGEAAEMAKEQTHETWIKIKTPS